MFNLNTEKFDFWPVYERIKKFYPLGINNENDKTCAAYPGLLELDAIIVENIHDEQNYKSSGQTRLWLLGEAITRR